ncbi:MAG: class I SAM-dependent methyltransferase [Terracidiphilus sp.]|nr:class I SAM-dependent methyltransferase [Terracidiphilus sp.]
MSTSDCTAISGKPVEDGCASSFEQCSWFYAACRVHLFRDHTRLIAESLWPGAGPDAGARILELGCGPGFYSCRFAQVYPQIVATGIDLSPKLIGIARSRAESFHLSNCDFVEADVCALPLPMESVDAIVMSRLFLVVTDRSEVLREVFRVLRPGGRCFIAEPISPLRAYMLFRCMQVLNALAGKATSSCPELRSAGVMTRETFAAMVRSQPWATSSLEEEGRYQYAVCSKGAPATSNHKCQETHDLHSAPSAVGSAAAK